MQNKNIWPVFLTNQVNEGTLSSKKGFTNVHSFIHPFIHSFNRCFLSTFYVPDTVVGTRDIAMARTQVLSSWSFQSSYSLLPYGHPVLLLCWVLISTGFPGLQLYVWVLVSSAQLCSICSLSSLFVHISSAIYNSWL